MVLHDNNRLLNFVVIYEWVWRKSMSTRNISFKDENGSIVRFELEAENHFIINSYYQRDNKCDDKPKTQDRALGVIKLNAINGELIGNGLIRDKETGEMKEILVEGSIHNKYNHYDGYNGSTNYLKIFEKGTEPGDSSSLHIEGTNNQWPALQYIMKDRPNNYDYNHSSDCNKKTEYAYLSNSSDHPVDSPDMYGILEISRLIEHNDFTF